MCQKCEKKRQMNSCKKCEMVGINMVLNPLDLEGIRNRVNLPDVWRELEAQGFHSDLVDRAYAHLDWTTRTGNHIAVKNARAFLASMGRGFKTPFDPDIFAPKNGDPYFDLKMRALTAIGELSSEFGDRVSSVVWNSLAHLATRDEPEESRSILKEQDSLPHHFGIVDTCLHALGKVYTFSLRVQSTFNRRTGMVLVHNCDCNCSLLNLAPSHGKIEFALDPMQKEEATRSLFTHLCAESHLILNDHLPFEYSITGEAALVLGNDNVCSVPGS